MFDTCLMIARDAAVMRRFPKTSAAIENIGHAILGIEHAIDWDISGDHSLGMTDNEFDKLAIMQLIKALKEGRPAGG